MRLVCLRDTHEQGRRVVVPDDDVLVRAGDLTFYGDLDAIAREADWLRGLPHPHKVVIAGSHDFAFERAPAKARAALAGLTYPEDAGTTVAGLRVWGSSWQPWFHDWVFNLARGPEIRARWDLVPAGLDLLVTNGPPLHHGDRIVGGAEVVS